MDGHECRELMLSFVLSADEGRRIDSHFFEKKYENIVAAVRNHQPISLQDAVVKPIQTGHTPSMQEKRFYNGHIALIKTDNLHDGYITTNFKNYLTDEGNRLIYRTFLQEGDIITTIIGANEKVIARSAMVSRELLPCNINQNIVQIRIDKNLLPPEYVYIYLNSYFGKNYLYYYSRQTEQFNLNCKEVEKVKVPRFSHQYMMLITEVSRLHSQYAQKANRALEEAEDILLHEIGMDMSKVRNGGGSIKLLSSSFARTGRLDAEFYQPKYDDYESHILSYPKGYTTPKNEFTLVNTKCKRNLDEYPYVEIGDVNVENGSLSYNMIATDSLPANAKIMTQKGDLIISTVRPNRGAVAIIPTSNLLVSGAFTVLRERGKYPAQTLQILFRTSMYKDWLLRFNVGTSYPVIKDSDVLDIPIPLLGAPIHKKIKEKSLLSEQRLDISRKLFEYAKQSLEMAIKENETVATKFLRESVFRLIGKQIN